jgi:hypothetical protein
MAEPADDVHGRQTGERIWPALYQQRPAPEDGDYFQSDRLRTTERLPPREQLQVYGPSEYAGLRKAATVYVVVQITAP